MKNQSINHAYLYARNSRHRRPRASALERDRIAHRTEPRAKSAGYNRRNGRIIVELTNGCTFAFPYNMAQGLETATDDELAAVEILGVGYGLHWEARDTNLSVLSLLAGLVGIRAYMATGWPGYVAQQDCGN